MHLVQPESGGIIPPDLGLQVSYPPAPTPMEGSK